MTRRAWFTEGEEQAATMADCSIEWDAERQCWRAFDTLGNEGFSQYMPLAAARCFVARFEQDGGHLDDPPAPQCTCDSTPAACPVPGHADARAGRLFLPGT